MRAQFLHSRHCHRVMEHPAGTCKYAVAQEIGSRELWEAALADQRCNNEEQQIQVLHKVAPGRGFDQHPQSGVGFPNETGWHRIAGRNPSCPSFNRTPPMYDGNFARFENRDNTSQLTPAHKATHKYLQRCSQAFDRPANPAIHPHAHPSVAIHHFSFSKQQSLHPPSCPSTWLTTCSTSTARPSIESNKERTNARNECGAALDVQALVLPATSLYARAGLRIQRAAPYILPVCGPVPPPDGMVPPGSPAPCNEHQVSVQERGKIL